MKAERVLVIPDLQIRKKRKKSDRGHDEKSLKAVERYMGAHKWDRVIYLGDFMDFPQLGRFNTEHPEELCNSLVGDYEVANEILDRHERILKKRNRNVKIDFLLGNHCIRPEKFVRLHPQLKGLIEIEHRLRLKERGYNLVRSYPKGEMLKVGKAYFHHGLYTSQNHAKKHATMFVVNIFYGHTHTVQGYEVARYGKKTIVGQSLGNLCDYDLEYVGKNPTSWVQAVTTFFFRPDGNFDYYISRLNNHTFTGPDGKVYKP